MKISGLLVVFFMGTIACNAVNSAQAAPISIVNPSFESVDGDGFPIGWGCSPEDADFPIAGFLQIAAYSPAAPPDGVNVVYLYDYNGGGQENDHVLFQALSDVLSPDTSYTLDIDVSRPDWSPGTLYELQLLAGSTVIATTGVTDSSSHVGGEFFTSTVSFPATSSNLHFGEPLMVAMVQYGDTVENEIDFDNVRLDATVVPEPSAIMLSGLGAIGMLAASRKKHKVRRTGIAAKF